MRADRAGYLAAEILLDQSQGHIIPAVMPAEVLTPAPPRKYSVAVDAYGRIHSLQLRGKALVRPPPIECPAGGEQKSSHAPSGTTVGDCARAEPSSASTHTNSGARVEAD